ncbi:hypothetical protein XAC3607_4010003 [Xanthomonas citri pv. citri]|nr:hypothetical protein XAC3615_13620006 [Xanthomonas citri pv. citri]CEH93410.1 hypothetical protein XAC3607_4010003 [Xanthomonas citri pv. citri]
MRPWFGVLKVADHPRGPGAASHEAVNDALSGPLAAFDPVSAGGAARGGKADTVSPYRLLTRLSQLLIERCQAVGLYGSDGAGVHYGAAVVATASLAVMRGCGCPGSCRSSWSSSMRCSGSGCV